MVYIQSALTVFLEIFCCKMFFETFCKSRENRKIVEKAALLVFLVAFDLWISVSLSSEFLLKQILAITAAVIVMMLYFKTGVKKAIVLMMIYQGIVLAVDYFAYSIQGAIVRGGQVEDGGFVENGMLITVFAKAILFFCILLIRKHFGFHYPAAMTDTQWLRFLFFPIFTIITIAAMISTFSYSWSQEQLDVMFIIAVGMAGLNIGFLYLIDDILAREQRVHENEMLLLQAKNMTGMYQKISNNFESQRKKTHEYKNHIMCIEGLMKQKNYDELEKYVTGIYGELKKQVDSINTNHTIINAILNTKYKEALEKNILFVLKVNDLSKIEMKEEDIVVILSNLLNNAIEACEKCEEKRVIKLKLVNEEDNLIIAVKNTYHDVVRIENGVIVTSKTEKKEEHGIGIRNIIHTVEKYGGSYVMKHTEDKFFFSIIIPQ